MKAWFAFVLLAATAPARAADPDPLAQTRVAAASGDANAQFALGEAYRTGTGIGADREAAISWYKRAAAAGHARASDTLGFLLFTAGQRSAAMPYIEKAAARGDPRAFYLLGTAHFNGDYAARDWPLGYAQMRRAADAGLVAARKSLIVMDKYLLAGDRARAETILTTLPPVRRMASETAATGVAPALPAAPAAPAPASPKPSEPTHPVQAAAIASPPLRVQPQPSPQPQSQPPSQTRTIPPATRPPPPTPAGRWRIQLGAYASPDRARADWTKWTARVPALRPYESRVVAAGAVQRLQANGIADRATAERLCRQLHATGGACFALAP